MELNKNIIEDIELELSGFCNASCPLCARNYKSFNEKYPTLFHRNLNEIINQLNEFPNLNIIRLVGSISEPTLYKDFFPLIEYLNFKNIDIEICTNGDTHEIIWWNRLARLLKDTDRIYFTICGSTQEIHEIYRLGTNLKNILNHSAEVRRYKNIDYAQCIKFEYNENDFETIEFKKMIEPFSHIYLTETYLKQDHEIYKDRKNLEFLFPPLKKKKSYEIIQRLTKKEDSKTIFDYSCKSINNKSLQIDLYGNYYPCYLFLEQNTEWKLNYDSIINNDSCGFCKKNISSLCKHMDGEYII